MGFCQKCKDEWKAEKLHAARSEAKRIAIETNETMAILKEGPIYKIVKATDAPKGAEYISKYN